MGTVLIWHMYSPSSLCLTLATFRVHALWLLNTTLSRVLCGTTRVCIDKMVLESDLIHATWNTRSSINQWNGKMGCATYKGTYGGSTLVEGLAPSSLYYCPWPLTMRASTRNRSFSYPSTKLFTLSIESITGLPFPGWRLLGWPFFNFAVAKRNQICLHVITDYENSSHIVGSTLANSKK